MTQLVKAAVCIAEVWLLAGGAAPAAVAEDAGACAEPAGSQPATAAKAAPQKTAASQTAASQTAAPQTAAPQTAAPQTAAPQGAARRAATPPPDVSGRKRVGKASFYAKQFAGKPMANGVPMDPQGNNAASRTLPLGTTAKVTNIETGKSAVVTIQDRGPYVDGRLVDLSPATAQQIGLTPRQGIAKVVVAPIAVPLPGGKVKEGAAAHEPLDQPDQAALHEEKMTRLATADSGTRHK